MASAGQSVEAKPLGLGGPPRPARPVDPTPNEPEASLLFGYGSLIQRWAPVLSRYAIATVAAASALLVDLSLREYMPWAATYPTPMFLAAVMLSAWYGGTGPGLLAVLFSVLAIDYYWGRPIYSFRVTAPDVPLLVVFSLSALFIAWLTGVQRRAEDQLREAHDELETRVRVRTAELERSNEALLAEFVERQRAEEALHKAQGDLARVASATTMGELAASIAHEVNQPLAAVVTNADACLRWLAAESPNLEEAREAARRIVRDGNRAGEVIKQIRALVQQAPPEQAPVDINNLIVETIALARSETLRNQVLIRTEREANPATVPGDRVQLQQVLLNLILNGIEAMSTVRDRPRELVLTTKREPATGEIVVSVRDCGIGLDPRNADQLFNAFFTTKPQGMGMGLSIARSIISAHGGRLWAAPNSDHGATFHFTVPAGGQSAS
jgi:C4-dicarboxylate-specific signal transduction histidine kinase